MASANPLPGLEDKLGSIGRTLGRSVLLDDKVDVIQTWVASIGLKGEA